MNFQVKAMVAKGRQMYRSESFYQQKRVKNWRLKPVIKNYSSFEQNNKDKEFDWRRKRMRKSFVLSLMMGTKKYSALWQGLSLQTWIQVSIEKRVFITNLIRYWRIKIGNIFYLKPICWLSKTRDISLKTSLNRKSHINLRSELIEGNKKNLSKSRK